MRVSDFLKWGTPRIVSRYRYSGIDRTRMRSLVKPWLAVKSVIFALLLLVLLGGVRQAEQTDAGGPDASHDGAVAAEGLSAPQVGESEPSPAMPRRRPVDGGPGYYGNFSGSLPTRADYFPIGVWLESVMDVPDIHKDIENGLNTYVDITRNSNSGQLVGTGLNFMASFAVQGSQGFVVSDEVDMWGGPGDGEWSGKRPGEGAICVPADIPCGYSIQRQLSEAAGGETVLRYANYGKGVTFWETDSEAARFVNGYQDIVSADNYWFTDPNICFESEGGRLLDKPRDLSREECRLAANYGWTVDRLRSLIRPAGSKPVWAFVEVGHPATEADAPTITPSQIRAAVWSSLIHEARGIIFFNHSFSGDCVSQHVLRDCGPRLSVEVGQLNQQLTKLAPVLNADFLDGALTVLDGSIDGSVKIRSGNIYLFAGSTQHAKQTARMRVACSVDGDAEVIDEKRSVPVRNGELVDAFADAESVHLYKLPGNTCGY